MTQPPRPTADNVIALARLMDAMGLKLEAALMHRLGEKMVEDMAARLSVKLTKPKTFALKKRAG